jgi:hypothetical protein
MLNITHPLKIKHRVANRTPAGKVRSDVGEALPAIGSAGIESISKGELEMVRTGLLAESQTTIRQVDNRETSSNGTVCENESGVTGHPCENCDEREYIAEDDPGAIEVSTTATAPLAPELDPDIEQLKADIRELYPRSQAMRREIGVKLLELQAKLAHYGDGTFIQTVVTDLHIPKSTCYELMEFARVKEDPESLSDHETNFEDAPEESPTETQAPRPTEQDYPRLTQIHIAVSEATREKLKKAIAKINAAGPKVVKQFSERITQEVFRVADKIKA